MPARTPNPVRDAMRHVDWTACVDASAWPISSMLPDGFPAPFDSFDLMPHRAAQIAVRRRRHRVGWIGAIGAGLLGAGLLHWHAVSEQRADTARYERLTQRLADLAPGLAERKRLEASLVVAVEHEAQLSALAPRRQQVVALLDAMEQASLDGVAVTAIVRDEGSGVYRRDDVASGRTVGDRGDRGRAPAGGGDEGDRFDDPAEVRVLGLADDADAVARWSERLMAHPVVERVELDALRRLADVAKASRGLNVFRITVRMTPSATSAQTAAKPAHAAAPTASATQGAIAAAGPIGAAATPASRTERSDELHR